MLKNKSIGTKVSMVMAIVILMALTAVSYLNINTSTGIIKSQVETSMKDNVNANAEVIAKQIEIYVAEVEATASKASIKSLDWAQQQPVLKADLAKYKFNDMAFATTYGELTKTDGSKADIEEREYFKEASEGKTAISTPELGKTNGKLVIHIATPVEDENGNIKGYVVAMLDGQVLSTLSQDVKGSASGYGYILDKDGAVIGHKNTELVKTRDCVFENVKKDKSLTGLEAIVSKMIKRQTGVDEYTYNGSDNYMSYTPIRGTTWFLASVGKKDEILSQINYMTNMSLILAICFILLSCGLCVLLITLMVTKPLKKSLLMIENLSKGHLKGRLEVKSNDEVGKMSAAMNNLADTLQNDVLGSMKEIAAGNINIEIAAKSENDEITPVILETAAKVRAIIGETQVIIDAVDNGDLSERCDDNKYTGEWKTLAQKINALCGAVAEPIDDVRRVLSKLLMNDFTDSVNGEYNGVFKKMADDINGVCKGFRNLQAVIVEVSNGDTHSLDYMSSRGKVCDNDELSPSIITLMQTVKDLIAEVEHLSTEAVNGNILNLRGDADKFEGGYKEIVEGFNSTLDAISAPLSETITSLDLMAKDDFTKSVSDTYNGEFKKLAEAVNALQANLGLITETCKNLSAGDTSELEKYKGIGKLSENDELVPSLIKMMESIRSIIDETTNIAKAAAQGELDVRGDEASYNGGYAEIIRSINSFLDAVEKPTMQIINVMQSISNAKFGESIDGEFHGKFETLVNSVNKTSLQLDEIIKEISLVITSMALGDFSIPEVNEYDGDLKAISDAINMILNSLNELLSSVYETSEQVVSGSKQVSNGSQLLSEGATEQASSIEELTSSMEEVSAQTKQNAVNAVKASNLSSDAHEKAKQGKAKMDEMLVSMQEINESSASISKIIKVIDDIAFQTNILALNAAVEAARAGQYGKGFAVVSEEVRNLAAKSAAAAKDTTALIESSIQKVESGTKIANETADMLNEISESIEKSTAVVENIATASNGQATAITQIDTGIRQVSTVVQTNSATAEQSAASSEELSGQADMLKNQVEKFRLREK